MDDRFKTRVFWEDAGVLTGIWFWPGQAMNWFLYAGRVVKEVRVTLTPQNLYSISVVAKPGDGELWMGWARGEYGMVPPRVKVDLKR